jgi:hypothetical protein
LPGKTENKTKTLVPPPLSKQSLAPVKTEKAAFIKTAAVKGKQ